MYVQLTTGKDSFRAQGPSPRRNVSVMTYVRVADDGEGKQTTPMFAAYKKKLRGFSKTSLIQTIPATDKFAENDAGQWFVNRHEVKEGTEILVEYRHRAPSSGFKENIEYLLLIADANAPLWQLRLNLPAHYLSAVPYVFFEGRFELVKNDSQLGKGGIQAWLKHLGLDEEDGIQLADYCDPSQAPEDQHWSYIELEAETQRAATVAQTVTEDGRVVNRIKRLRRIKVR